MIYFDNAATTKPSEKALQSADKYNKEQFFNPSALYRGGLDCAADIKIAKESILKTVNAQPKDYEVIFTSCGSEGDNQAIFCCVKRGVFVTDAGEHSAVYKAFVELKNRGLKTELIGLNRDGSVKTDELFDFIEKNAEVSFVSIMHVNNETGAINDVNYIADRIKTINPKIIMHVDGVQAFGKLPYKISDKIDFYVASAHKINGLKGCGAIIKRKKTNLNPLIFGGGQENGLRSGTENVFGIKVFGFVAKEHYENIEDNYRKVSEIKEYISDNLDKTVYTIISGEKSSPYILSVAATGLRGEVLMHMLETKGIVVGNGSACSSKNRYSRVLAACGYTEKVLDGVLRISFSADNTLEEAETAVEIINACGKELKEKMK